MLAACQRPLTRGGALVLSAIAVALPRGASAQRVNGSIDVSLVIAAPVAVLTVVLTEFRLDRDGMATIRTTPLAASQAGRLVMARVSSSSTGFAAARYAPARLCDAPGRDCDAPGLVHRVDVGRLEADGAPHDVLLHLEYLVVPGT